VEAEVGGQPGEAVEAGAVLPVVAGGEEEVAGGGSGAPAVSPVTPIRPRRGPAVSVWGVEEKLHPFAPVDEVVHPEVAGALLGPEAARRDEPAEAAPGGTVAGQRGRGEAVPEDDAGRGDQAGGGADVGRRGGAVGDGLEPGDGLLPALRTARIVVEGAVGGPAWRGGPGRWGRRPRPPPGASPAGRSRAHGYGRGRCRPPNSRRRWRARGGPEARHAPCIPRGGSPR
jgi:hypothetical protein